MELLKLRFGEAPMHFCEVMLKDMADSRRINANIREEDEKRPADEQPPFGVYAVILSSEFWPPFKDEKLEVPEDIREALEVYCKKYEKLKVLPPPCSGRAPRSPSSRGVHICGPLPAACGGSTLGRGAHLHAASPAPARVPVPPGLFSRPRHSGLSPPLSTLWPPRTRAWGVAFAPGSQAASALGTCPGAASGKSAGCFGGV